MIIIITSLIFLTLHIRAHYFFLQNSEFTGHPTGLQVLPGCERYYRETNTQLVLKEKFWSMSGDSCSVKV